MIRLKQQLDLQKHSLLTIAHAVTPLSTQLE